MHLEYGRGEFSREPSPLEKTHAVLTGQMGMLQPFAGDVAFQPGEMDVGALVAYTESAKDGTVEQLSAAPIRLGAGAP